MSDCLYNLRGVEYEHIIYPDLSIPKDKVTFIKGESGSGKTTLLRLLNGMLTPRNGTIQYNGVDLSDIDTIQLRREVSLVSQSVFLFAESVRNNIHKFYEYREQTPPKDDIIQYYLNLCCIETDLNKDCSVLSGGERQRVYLAIFLSFQPKVILLDEPTSALDVVTSEKVLNNIIQYSKENRMTTIIVSHDQKLTEKLSEYLIVLGDKK